MVKKLPVFLALFLALALVLAFPHALIAADAAPDAEPQPGLVSLDLPAIIWVLISFTLVLIVLYKAAWKNVLGGLKAREERIRKNIADAEAASAKADATLKEYAAKLAAGEEQVRQLLVKAASEAEKIAMNIRTQAATDAQGEMAKARKEIEGAKRDAIQQVYDQTADLATSVAAKIIGRNLNAQDQQDLVNQTLGQMESLGKR